MLTSKELWHLAGEGRSRKRRRQKGKRKWKGNKEKIGKTGGWSWLSEGPCKVVLKFTVVTVTSTKALCATESCRIDGQRKLLSFDIQIIFKYSNKKLVLYSPSGFLSTTGLSNLLSPLFPMVSLTVCCVSPHPLSVLKLSYFKANAA